MFDNNSNIWDDAECTVGEEYTSPSSVKAPNQTFEFKNTLIANKGDIKSAKKFSFDLSMENSSVNDSDEQSCIFSLSDSCSSDSYRDGLSSQKEIQLLNKSLVSMVNIDTSVESK